MSNLTVLMYHKVSENKQDYLTVSTAQLKEQLNWLKQRYTFITLRHLNEHIENQKALPEKALLITFDDGYENNYTLAYPIFKELGIPFSIFLVSAFIGKNLNYDSHQQQFLNIEQLQKMQDIVQYGHHSLDHKNLMDLSQAEWVEEIGSGIKALKTLPLTIENAWAYTYGSFPKRNKSQFANLSTIFKSNGVSCAFRIGNRINRLPLSKPYAIQRLDIRGDESFDKFKRKVRFGKIL